MVKSQSLIQCVSQGLPTTIPVFDLGIARLQIQDFLVTTFARGEDQSCAGL